MMTEQDLELIGRNAGQSLPLVGQSGPIARTTPGQPDRCLTNSKTHRVAVQFVDLRAIKRPHSWESTALPVPFDDVSRRNLRQRAQATPENRESLQRIEIIPRH